MTNTHKSFQQLVDASRRAGRLNEPMEAEAKTRTVQAGVRLLPEELAQARELAAKEDRSGSSFIRRIYLRGLDSYLSETAGASGTQ